MELGRELYRWERAVLEEGDLFLVGGSVRDMLLGLRSETLDVDYLVTGLPYDRLVSILGRFGRTNLVGKSFGVVKFTTPGGAVVDVALPRTESSTGLKHRDFDVAYDPALPVETDLVRRDFTINSMALHCGDGHVVDPLGGMGDLSRRLLRVNREDAFGEDPLRILRGVQFLARFALSVDGRTRELMRRDGSLLRTVSSERVRDELNKLLVLSEHPADGFVFMHENGLLMYVLPELEETSGVEQNEHHVDDVFFHSIKSCDAVKPALHLRWSALLHDIGKGNMKRVIDNRIVFYRHEEESARVAEGILERLRFPNDFKRTVAHLIRSHMFHITDEWSDSAIRRFVSRVGREHLDDLFSLREADALSRGDTAVKENLQKIKMRIQDVTKTDGAFQVRDLAVDGSDVMRILGIAQGPEVGAVLRSIFEMVLENPGLNERDTLINIIKDMKKN